MALAQAARRLPRSPPLAPCGCSPVFFAAAQSQADASPGPRPAGHAVPAAQAPTKQQRAGGAFGPTICRSFASEAAEDRQAEHQ
eukprot:scaffold324647_cov43-Prasinocladus_malaysianus.AAC.1